MSRRSTPTAPCGARRQLGRQLFFLSAIGMAACVNLPDCGHDGAAGDPCSSGQDCASGVCLARIHCADGGEPISVCASSRCGEGCPDSETCVHPFGSSHQYCYPLSVCRGGDGGDEAREQPDGGSPYDGEPELTGG